MKKIPMTSLRQTWRTPRALYQGLDAEFSFDFDPCPPNPKFDGLKCEWGDASYVNPPFKTIAQWVEKAYSEWKKGKTVVLLIPARTCTRWWHEYVMNASEIRFIKGRLHYDDAKTPAPFPSCIVVFRGCPQIGEGSSVPRCPQTSLEEASGTPTNLDKEAGEKE